MQPTLKDQLFALKRRLFVLSVGASAGWAILTALLILIVWMWIDLAVELPPWMRVSGDLASAGMAIYVAARMLQLAVHRAAPAELGKRLDRAAGAQGQIISGIDLLMTRQSSGAASTAISAGLKQIAIERAERIATRVTAIRVIPNDPFKRAVMLLVGLASIIGMIAIAAPRLAATQIARFADPFGDHPPYSAISFDVQPGNTSIVYGGNIDIHVTAHGGPAENLEVVLHPQNSPDDPLPMFPDSGGAWQATISNITSPTQYFIRARGARSTRFNLDVITVPKISDVRFRITPPAYTHRPAYEGPIPQGGLAGLPGTTVQMWIKSNRPLNGGAIKIGAGSVAMSRGEDENTAAGSFSIQSAGNLTATVTDTAGESSTDIFTTSITLLTDEKPFVQMTKPEPTSFATPTVTIPVEVQAEDDYGVSRIELYRGLNDLRAMPQELAVPPSQPTRITQGTELDFKDYGLKPGDVVKLYARVEDNDPAGPKGAESPVSIIRIISDEEMQKLELSKQAMDLLQSKYAEAQTQIAEINKQIDQLQKELQKLDPNSPLAKEKRDEIAKLGDQMEKEAGELSKTAKQDLPFDIDRAFRKQLDDLANDVHEAADETKQMAGDPSLSASAADKKLDELRKKLGDQQGDLDKNANQPLDQLAKIYPLKEDEARFIELAREQRDVEQRMQSLRGSEGKNDPDLKARMRDFEDEQTAIQKDLKDLLNDIDNHIAALPDDPKFAPMRETAQNFVNEVRTSGADDAMASAESSLGDDAGTAAHDSAKTAADTLEKFISKCNAVGDQAGMCMKFNPSLSENLGDSVEQLLEASGLGSKPGLGMGNGGGYSARRSTMSNVGLYGHIPMHSNESKFGGESNSPSVATDGRGPLGDHNQSSFNPSGGDQSVGDAAASVPEEYRHRVGEYFRRVADELGEPQK